MEFALSENNERIFATRHAKGFCTICKEPMIAKCGNIKIHHWAHKSSKNCDPWWENESDWHRKWKNLVHKDFRENVIEKNGIKHRADIQLLFEVIIEFQKSPLSLDERLEREIFYENMVWVIHFPRDKILEINDRKMYTKLFGDYYVKVKNFSKGFCRPPHPCPIFLDFDNGEMFWIKEFDDYDNMRARWFYGTFINREEFVNCYLRAIFFSDLEKLKISHRHRDYEKEQEQLRAEREIKREEEWRKKQGELQKIREEEYQKNQEELKKIRDADKNYKWGSWTEGEKIASSLKEKLKLQSMNQWKEFE